MEDLIPTFALGALLTASVLYNFRQMGGQRRLIEERAGAVTAREEALRQRDELKGELEGMREHVRVAEREAIEARERERAAHRQMQDWEKEREETRKSSHAALVETGQKLASQVLEHHKREAEEQRKQREQELATHREDWLKRYHEVVEGFASARKDAHGARTQMELVMRALTSPGGAGQMSEVGLENALKNLGLERGRDYYIQPQVTAEGGASLRPDALVFLPNDMVIVVDCKASKYLFDYAEAENSERRQEVEARLVRTMNDHIKALISRDYGAAVERSYKELTGRKLSRIFNLMYVHSDAGVEKIRALDPEFDAKLLRANLIPASASTLYGLFSLAKQSIAEARQAENEQKIIEAARELMEGVAMSFAHIEKMGRSMESSVRNFSAFGKSFNRYVLGKMHKLERLGVEPAKNKSIPSRLATYDVHRAEDIVEGAAEELPMLEEAI